jgi:hypothetical protein
MKIKQYSDGSMMLHIDDDDDYIVTDNNGVDIWLTKEQVKEVRGFP